MTPAEAAEKANLWIDAARPVIKAYLLMDSAKVELYAASYAIKREARPCIDQSEKELLEIVEGIRENHICDHIPKHPCTLLGTDEEWEAHDEFCDELRDAVKSVELAIRAVEAEA